MKVEFIKNRVPGINMYNIDAEKLDEEKPNSELIDRMDCVINRLDRITEAVEKLVDTCNIEIHTDVDELNQKVSEKYHNEESNEAKHKSDEYVKDDLFTILDMMNSRKSDDNVEKKVDFKSFFDDEHLSNLKRIVMYKLDEEQCKKIMDESSSEDSIKFKPIHSYDLDDLLYNTVRLPLNMQDYESILYDDYLSELRDTLLSSLNKEKDKEILDELSRDLVNKKPKKTIFCILGESGSGKDTLVEYTLKEFKLDLKPVLSYTDRPIRQGEQNGKEHIFLSKDEMTEFLKSNKKDIAAYTQIGETGYRYCAMTSVIDRSDIYIIDPNGLKEFKERTGDRYNIVSIYIDCPLKERRKRTEGRSDAASKFEARVAAESDQFAKFREEHGYDHVIDNGSMSTIYRSAVTLADIFRHYRRDIRDAR